MKQDRRERENLGIDRTAGPGHTGQRHAANAEQPPQGANETRSSQQEKPTSSGADAIASPPGSPPAPPPPSSSTLPTEPLAGLQQQARSVQLRHPLVACSQRCKIAGRQREQKQNPSGSSKEARSEAGNEAGCSQVSRATAKPKRNLEGRQCQSERKGTQASLSASPRSTHRTEQARRHASRSNIRTEDGKEHSVASAQIQVKAASK